MTEGDRIPLIHSTPGAPPPAPKRDDARLRAMMDAHFDSIWRALRRFGLSTDAADDAAQRVFLVASRRLDEIAEGAERSFLLRTALRVACSERRALARRREVIAKAPIDPPDESPAADELLDQRQARELLDRALDDLGEDLRVVFVLFEIEGCTVPEIAEMLELPVGTASSRLRRAREEFGGILKRMRARLQPRRRPTP